MPASIASNIFDGATFLLTATIDISLGSLFTDSAAFSILFSYLFDIISDRHLLTSLHVLFLNYQGSLYNNHIIKL